MQLIYRHIHHYQAPAWECVWDIPATRFMSLVPEVCRSGYVPGRTDTVGAGDLHGWRKCWVGRGRGDGRCAVMGDGEKVRVHGWTR